MPKKAYCVNAQDLPKQERFGGAMKETAIVMDHALLKFAWGKSGGPEMSGRLAEKGAPDVHPWDQAIILISGRVEVTLGHDGEDGVYTMEPGWVVYIPANMPHIGRVLGEEEAFGVDIFAPARKDYFDMAQHQLSREDD